MNVDEAMQAAAEFRADMETRPAWTLFSQTVAVVLSFEVERLRAELAEAKAASVCSVGITDLSLCGGGQRIEFYIEGDKTDGGKMLVWLRDRMKDKTPPEA